MATIVQLSPDQAAAFATPVAAPTDAKNTPASAPVNTGAATGQLNFGSAPTNPDPSYTPTDDTKWLVDVGSAPFAQQNPNNGLDYAPGGDANPANIASYNSKGEPLFGINGLPRVTKITDTNGNTHSEFVMPPGHAPSNTGNKTIDTISNGVQGVKDSATRMALGAGLNAVKGVAGLGEWLGEHNPLDPMASARNAVPATGNGDKAPAGTLSDLVTGKIGNGPADTPLKPEDSLPTTATIGDHLVKGNVNPKDVNFIDENFPTMPAYNAGEKAVQDIGGQVVLAILGGGGMKAVQESTGLATPVASLLTKYVPFFIKSNPDEAAAAAGALAKAGMTELGANVGVTVGTNSNTKPLSSGLSDQIPLLDQNEKNRVGDMIDNTGFGLGLQAVRGVAGAAVHVGRALTTGFAGAKPETELAGLLRKLDPTITDKTSNAEIKRRALILSDVINQHSTTPLGFTNSADDVLQRDSVGTLANGGAEDYFRQVNAIKGASLPPDEFNAFVTNKANQMIHRAQSFKYARNNAASPIVADSNSDLVDGVTRTLGNVANSYGSNADAANAALTSAQPSIQSIADTRQAMQEANAAKDAAQAHYETVQNGNAINNLLTDALSTSKLGVPVTEQDIVNKLGHTVLPAQIKDAAATVDKAYANITPGLPYDYETMANIIKGIGDNGRSTALDVMGIPHSAGRLKPVGNDVTDEAGNVVSSPVDDLTAQLQQAAPDIKTLVNKVRPNLSRAINAAYMGQVPGINMTNVDQFKALRNTIDGFVAQSKDPTVQAAHQAYAQFADRFLGTNDLRNFAANSQVGHLHDTGYLDEQGNPIVRGEADQQLAGTQTIENALKDDSGVKIANVMKAFGGNNPEMSQVVLGRVLQSLASTDGKPLTSSAIRNALNQYGMALRNTDPDMYNVFNDAVNQLQNAGNGLADATKAATQAEATGKVMIEKFNQKAISKFADDIAGGTQFTDNPDAAFNNVFSQKGAVTNVAELQKQAALDNNPALNDGLKSQFLRYLLGKISTTKPISVGTEGAVRQPSNAALQHILNGHGDNTLNVLDQVFADDPQTATAVKRALTELQGQIDLSGAHAETYGSPTVYNAALEGRNIADANKFFLGPLSHLGARITVVSHLLTSNAIKGQQAKALDIIDRLITDPNELSDAAKKLGNTGYDARHKFASGVNALYDKVGRSALKGALNEANGSKQTPNSWLDYKIPATAQ